MIKSFLLLFFKKAGIPGLICKLRRGTAPTPTRPCAGDGRSWAVTKKEAKNF
jgi:hypothetical protein